MTSNSFQVEYSEQISSEIDDLDGEDKDAADAMKSTEVDSDDSDVPVGVSWQDSKSAFEQDEKNRKNAVKFARSLDKAKRRKKNEMFISQKEAKRKLTKLPEEIVQEVVKKPKRAEPDEIEKGHIRKREKRRTRKVNKKKKESNREEEYCHVVILDQEVNKCKKIQESAAEFLTNHFYGNRLQRTSASKQLTMQSKSSGAAKPSLKFSNKV